MYLNGLLFRTDFLSSVNIERGKRLFLPVRLSFSDTNDESDIDYILEVLPPIVNRLRAMSPLWDAIIHGRTVE